MGSFDIRELSYSQMTFVFRQWILQDFAPDEIKDLSILRRQKARHAYLPLGALRDGEIIAYAFMALGRVQGEDCALLDYFAVRRDWRDRQVGSEFLRRLNNDHRWQLGRVFLEVEVPGEETAPQARAVMERRHRFYEKNGMWDTGVRSRVFGVPYAVLSFPGDGKGGGISPGEAYAGLYRQMLPREMYRSCIQVRMPGQKERSPRG